MEATMVVGDNDGKSHQLICLAEYSLPRIRGTMDAFKSISMRAKVGW